MFIDDTASILDISKASGFTIFVGFDESTIDVFPKNSTFVLRPEKKSSTESISIDSAREFFARPATIESTDQYYIIVEPELMNLVSMNFLLKTLEEPRDHIHYIFLTHNPSALLPTILSRAHIYYKITKNPLDSPVDVDEKLKTYAKRLLAATEKDLIALSKEIADKKDRQLALTIISTAIILATKSYFRTNNPVFLKKIPNLLTLHENIRNNGHIKLHFVADMI